MKLNCKDLMNMLPHKHPFILLDKVIELNPGVSAKGIKNITINEPYFMGHFPMEPIVPGVLLVESLAQLSAIMYGSEFIPSHGNTLDFQNINPELIASKVGYLVEIKNVKFKKTVCPGDTVILRCFKKSSFALMSQVLIEAYVDNNQILEGIIVVSQRA